MTTEAAATPAPILDRLSLLADPVRSRLLLVLEDRELTVTELTQVLRLPQSTVSRHLKALAQMDWVSARPEGNRRLYRARPDGDGRDALWQVVRAELEARPVTSQDRQRLQAILAERPDPSQEFFSTSAESWGELRRELFGRRFELLGLAGLLDPGWTVGDLGTGHGDSARALAPWVERVIAVDASPEMLAIARRRLDGLANVEVREGRLEDPPIPDGELDAALLSLVLHHLEEPAGALAAAARALKPGGRLLVLDMQPHEREEFRQEMGHRWLGFAPEQISEWLERSDLTAARIHQLPVDPEASGPALFAATARKPN